MTNITIDKLFKKPSLLASAKHYRLELHNDSLYVLEMSKARPNTNLKRNSLNGLIANKVLDQYEIKFEKQYESSLQELQTAGIDNFINKKNYFVIRNLSKQNFQIDGKEKTCIISVNGKKIKLFAVSPYNFSQLNEISTQIYS
jgi:hypothetical protein